MTKQKLNLKKIAKAVGYHKSDTHFRQICHQAKGS
jgi:hypothetical protein